jgi:hypothetical protein
MWFNCLLTIKKIAAGYSGAFKKKFYTDANLRACLSEIQYDIEKIVAFCRAILKLQYVCLPQFGPKASFKEIIH